MENIILTNNKDLRLVSVKVGVLSTLRFELPLVSASATHVEVIVTSGNVPSAYTATFIDATKRWQCDIAASQFPAVGRQSYEVAYVLDGKQFWDGKGWIEIENATTSGIEPQPRPEPYRYVVVSVNGYGADAQGAVRTPKTFIATDSPTTTEGFMEGDIYFNRETGATWTLCNVQSTLTWVFNYKNYYTKQETDEAIDRVAAYYITYDAAGNPFPTYASLANATTVYSGGSVRVPTRNDYCVVLADETHGGAEYRYIYAVAEGETTGSWQPQFPVEGVMTVDQTVQKNSQNPVSGGGVWSMLWGALAALPTGFSSLYDWCVAQLAGKASKADATLTERGPNHDGFSAWTVTPSTHYDGSTVWDLRIEWLNGGWCVVADDPFSPGVTATFSTSKGTAADTTISWVEDVDAIENFTATRTVLQGYQLGSQSDKPLASEAEAEALRQGKLDKSAVVSPSSSATAGQAADAKATGDALALIAPDWVQTSAYSAYECVKYNGAYWYAKADIAANTAWNADNWGSLANLAAVIKKFLPLTGGRVYSDIRIGYEMFIGADGTARAPKNGIWWSDLSIYNFPTCGIQCGSISGDLVLFSEGARINLPRISGTLALLKDIAPAFSRSATYAVNALCVHEGVLYRCTTAITTAGAWTGSTNWTEATVEDVLAALRTAIADKANRAANPTAGNLAALDASGNPTDAGWTAGDLARYALVTKTIDNGAVSLDDRASNSVTVSATLSPNTLTINFPTAPTVKLRDFAMRLNIAAGVTAPEIAWPQGVTLENNGGEVPEIADGGTGGSSTILYFSETENNGTTAKFLVKGETLTAIAQA